MKPVPYGVRRDRRTRSVSAGVAVFPSPPPPPWRERVARLCEPGEGVNVTSIRVAYPSPGRLRRPPLSRKGERAKTQNHPRARAPGFAPDFRGK